MLQGWGHHNLAYAKIAESHADAESIAREAGRSLVVGHLYAVWASRSARSGLTAVTAADGYVLSGQLRFASGASFVDRALVTATCDEGTLLFDIAVDDPAVHLEWTPWTAQGMADTQTVDLRIDELHLDRSAALGPPDWYLSRPGFWANGIGIAAIWTGGAARVVDDMRDKLAAQSGSSPHQRVHLGASVAAVYSAHHSVQAAAEIMDKHPADNHRALACAVRHVVEGAVTECIWRSGRALGPGPLVRDAAFAQHVADLGIFVRQHGSEADLDSLGEATLAPGASRWYA